MCVCVCVCVRMCVHVYEEKGTQCDYINCLNLVRRWSFPNFLQSTITIEEPPPLPSTAPPTNNPLLIHAIIWPIVGGVILIILLAVALYCVSTLGRSGGGHDCMAKQVTEIQVPPVYHWRKVFVCFSFSTLLLTIVNLVSGLTGDG